MELCRDQQETKCGDIQMAQGRSVSRHPRIGRTDIVEFRPEQTRMKVGAIKGTIGTARKIKDWKALDRAIDELIAEQQEFIAWWDAMVTPEQQIGLKHRSHQAATTMSAADATDQTGISKQQVSRWRDR